MNKNMPLWAFLLFVVLFASGLWVAFAFYAHAPVPQIYPPRASCWGGDWRLIAMHDAANTVIFVEYLVLPALLLWLGIVERMWRVRWVFPLQVAEWANFIAWCGITHLVARVEIYRASPWLAGGVLVVTAVSGLVAFGHTLAVIPEMRLWLRSIRQAAGPAGGDDAAT